jgi:hypothetical protein
MMKIKSQTLKNLNEMMMVVVVPQMQNTSKIKSNKKFRIVAIEEDDDDRSESCQSDNSPFSQISSIEPQGEPELLQFS